MKKTFFFLIEIMEEIYLASWQGFSQRAVWVSFGYLIADFGHPKIHILCV